ncbi:Aldehyde dehydrogenase [Yarrowia sp. B02]|nr:Aldehyde dehydrogenase [Yarrowia sp. B02]
MSVLTTVSPIDAVPDFTTPEATKEQALAEIATANKAQKTWKQTTLDDRIKLVTKAYEHLTSEPGVDELARELTQQMGRPIAYTKGEITTAAARAKFLLEVAPEALAPQREGSDAGFVDGFKKYITHEPLGTVLIIFPWNYPYLCLTNALVPSLLAGNAVIIKPSPQTPKVADAFAKAFKQAGLPEGVLQVLHSGDNELISDIIANPGIHGVSFTGSVAGGLAVQKAAAGRTIPVALELGGNDAAYVRPDVDVDAVAEDIVDGCVFNSGQSCCSIERVYVHADIYDAFEKAVVKVLSAYKVGDPLDKATQLGPVVSVKSKQNVEAQIKDALAKGGKALIPEGTFVTEDKAFVAPQILVGMSHDAEVLVEETFGPLVPLYKVQSDQEAIDLINDSKYGLTSSVWTKDLIVGEALGNEIEAGTVFVNRADYPDPTLAWTGWKNSGRGVSLSRFGFAGFTKLKSHHVKKV